MSDALHDGLIVLSLNGEFDFSNSHDFERLLSEAFEGDPTRIVVDLRGISFLDSTMLETLVRGFARASQRDIRFALVRPNPLVWRVFVLTRLNEQIANYPSLQEAFGS